MRNARYLDTLKHVRKSEQVVCVERDLATPPSRVQSGPDAAYRAWIEEGQLCYGGVIPTPENCIL